MARINRHHITYNPEWILDIYWLQHKTISSIQRSKATPELYMYMTNYMHSLTHEWNRIREELDIGGDLRVKKPKPSEKMKRTK